MKTMFSSSLIVVVVAAAVVLAPSSSKMALAQCPCYSYDMDDSYMVCEDPSLTSIPDCVPLYITTLSIRTPSIPLIPDTIRRFTNLSILFIGRFENPQLSKTFLSGQPNISFLSIYQSSLDYVDNDWFQYAPRITTLHFNTNKIASLAADTFRSLPLLSEVSLFNNELTTLPPTLFEGTALNILYLDENPWHCDCELANSLQWTRDHGVVAGDGAFCLHPEELQGLELSYLTPDLACKNISLN